MRFEEFGESCQLVSGIFHVPLKAIRKTLHLAVFLDQLVDLAACRRDMLCHKWKKRLLLGCKVAYEMLPEKLCNEPGLEESIRGPAHKHDPAGFDLLGKQQALIVIA